jgi:pimeloyl-ACP methyl ester carboxylesterase
VALTAGAAAGEQRVAIVGSGGVTLAASYFEPSRRPAPAVILLHMLTRSRADWQIVGARLAEGGIAALAIDFRGHGESAAAEVGPEGYGALVLDVRAAVRHLRGLRDVDASRIGIAGASLGASVAALAAAEEPAVRSIALLSGVLDYRGLRIEQAMRTFAGPAFLVASDEDLFAVRSARQIAAAGTGIRELRVLQGAGHGTVMLARQPDLVRALVDWFARTLE